MTDRRLLLSDPAWTPGVVGPTAWYYAASTYVSLNGANVVTWADKTVNGGDIIQSNPVIQPLWEARGGWNSVKPSIRSESETLATASAGAAPIESAFSGSNKPFTVLMTTQVSLFVGDSFLCRWSGTGVSQSCVVNSSQFLSITRTDGVTTRTGTATVSPIGTGHVRLAYTFDGVFGNVYLNTLRVVSDVQLDVGSTAFTQFTVGDCRDMRMTEIVVYPRALNAAGVAAYYAYSLAEWGA